MKLYVINLSQF